VGNFKKFAPQFAVIVYLFAYYKITTLLFDDFTIYNMLANSDLPRFAAHCLATLMLYSLFI